MAMTDREGTRRAIQQADLDRQARKSLMTLAQLVLRTMGAQERWRNTRSDKDLGTMRSLEKRLAREAKLVISSGGAAPVELPYEAHDDDGGES